jgi:single-stranded-DNA-specific exonuclease
MAAGLSLRAERYEGFVPAFEAATRASADAVYFTRTIASDGPLVPAEIGLALVEATERQIWGQGLPPPLYANQCIVAAQRIVQDQHLWLNLDLAGRRFAAIWFRRTESLPARALLAYRPAVDEYQGERCVQLVVEHRG